MTRLLVEGGHVLRREGYVFAARRRMHLEDEEARGCLDYLERASPEYW